MFKSKIKYSGKKIQDVEINYHLGVLLKHLRIIVDTEQNEYQNRKSQCNS